MNAPANPAWGVRVVGRNPPTGNESNQSLNGTRRYTVFYEKRNVQFAMKTTMTALEYDEQFEIQADQGRRVVALNAYRHNGQRYYAAIWQTGNEGGGIHEVDRDGYRQSDADWLNAGREAAIVTGVDAGGGGPLFERHRYGATWC